MSASKHEELDWHEYLAADPELRQELEDTLHSAPAQETVSLERLYARLLGTVPQAQASFQEQLRSDLIDPPQVFDDAPVHVKTRSVAETPSAITNNKLTSASPRQRSPYFWPLTIAAILMLGLIATEALLWLATKPPTYADVVPIPAITVPPSPAPTLHNDTPVNQVSSLDLSYSGATQLNYDAQKFWLDNRPTSSQALNIGFFASNDDYQKVSDFYEKTFKAASYQVMTSTITAGYNELTVYNQSITFELIFLNPSARQLPLHSNFVRYNDIFNQLKPDQTLIAYFYGPPAAFKDLPLRSDYLPFPFAPNNEDGIFVGPDNTFHGTGLAGSGKERLVSTNAPRKFGVGDGKYFQVDWLISEDYHLSVGTTLTGPKDSQFFTVTDKPATVKDETGHTYQLKVVQRFDTMPADGQIAHHLIWQVQGSDMQLPSGTRQATFDSTQALLFVPPVSLQASFTLATFQAAKLPLASAISFVPGRSALANGLKVSVPYAYFGPDRTLLAVHLESKDITNSTAKTYTVAYATNPQPSATITISFSDDKNLPILPLPNAQPNPYYNPISMDGEGEEVIMILNPLSPGTKNLTLTINSSTFNLTGNQLQLTLPIRP